MTIIYNSGAATDLMRWMLFVDGENLTLRAQELAKCPPARRNGEQPESVQFESGKFYQKDEFIWFSTAAGGIATYMPGSPLRRSSIRSHYYTACVGDKRVSVASELLRGIGFEPVVFSKKKGARSKGVDITLTKDALMHAFFGHYDACVLCSGDGDFVPLVNEIKRLGKMVIVTAFPSGLSPKLKLAADKFFPLDNFFYHLPVLGIPREP